MTQEQRLRSAVLAHEAEKRNDRVHSHLDEDADLDRYADDGGPA
jgi:hypothetical protein